ncbi:MAG: bacteriohopanetetrol glucosamine biosynthesis glycosyltransferase HpnI [Candidatus Binataceae bacterium]|jgi:ceramide glucosyltransferase
MKIIADFAAACVAISLGYYVAASIAALRFAMRASSPAPPLPASVPRVAILKPLHGLTQSLRDQIVSYFKLDYPRVDYYFGVADAADRAAEVPVELHGLYPQRPMELVVGGEPGCANRKVAKLIKMGDLAGNADLFVMSDADIAVDSDHLRRLVGELAANDKLGVVSCLYRARPGGPLASRLEALAVNTDFTPMVMLSAAIEPVRFALGATVAIKRPALDAIGGFRVLKDMLADDYYIGKLAADRGWGVALSSSIVTTVTHEQTFADFWNHQLRWARTYRTIRPLSLATILIHGPFWALVLVVASGASAFAIKALILVLIARLAMATLMLRNILRLPELTRDVWLVPFKDLCMTGIWCASLLSNKVQWAGRTLEILADGTLREVDG